MKVKILAHTPNPERVIALAGKLCYSPVGIDELNDKISDEEVNKFISKLADMGHMSPFEHASFTFAIEGISRNCSHQIVRHRVASFSQQSQRYVKMNGEYVVPPEIAEDEDTKALFIRHMKESQWYYDELVDKLIENKVTDKYPDWISEVSEEFGKLDKEEFMALDKNILNLWKKYHIKEYNTIEKEAIEDARYVLPSAYTTKMEFTMNVRELLHFFKQRCCKRAQWEIRTLANEMLKQCKEVSPLLFKNAGAPCSTCTEGELKCK